MLERKGSPELLWGGRKAKKSAEGDEGNAQMASLRMAEVKDRGALQRGRGRPRKAPPGCQKRVRSKSTVGGRGGGKRN